MKPEVWTRDRWVRDPLAGGSELLHAMRTLALGVALVATLAAVLLCLVIAEALTN